MAPPTAHDANAARVRDPRGHVGRIVGDVDDGIVAQLDDGRRVLLPRESLRRDPEGGFAVGFDLDPSAGAARPGAAAPAPGPASVRDSGTIPVLAEELVVDRQARVTGGVRLHKSVSERVALVDEPVVRERVTVERVTLNRPLAAGAIPVPREEDGVLIVPVIEEVLVVEKRLVLKEELHVRRTREEARERQEVTLRREHVDVERFDAGDEPRGH
jgi:uncharacterized protein (TIGR02271 family)